MMPSSSNVLTLFSVWFSILFTCGLCGRIIGGRPAKENEFPYQVSIKHSYNDEHRCGGTIITSKFILTAAHCLKYRWGGTYPSTIISVIAGQLDHIIRNDSIFRNASRLILHENSDQHTYANDIALIELEDDLPIDNKTVSAIPLNGESLSSGTCAVSGWGVLEDGSTTVSDTLMVAHVGIIEFSKCKHMYTSYEGRLRILDGMMCAGHADGETDSCGGDSGGPLVCNGVLTGIVSAGAYCGSSKFPGVYADVSQYVSWIESKIFAIPTTLDDVTSVTTESISSPTEEFLLSTTVYGRDIANNTTESATEEFLLRTTIYSRDTANILKSITNNTGISSSKYGQHIMFYLLFTLFIYFYF